MKKLMFTKRKITNHEYLKRRNFYISRLLNCILALLIFFIFLSNRTNTIFSALESDGTNYIVSSENDLKDAISAINTGESGEYSITLNADITVGDNLRSSQFKLEKNSVTIYGENHTLYLTKTCIMVTNNSKLNLGNSNYSKTLSIEDKAPQTGNACEPLIAANNATLNMYNGVTLSGRNGVDTAGGVQLEKATFNMYGGEILNCRTDTAGGGVLAAENSQFKMTGGTIKNCNNSLRGGGVSLFSNSKFEMTGGTIKDCSSVGSGGGVYVSGNSEFNMTGGTIQGCSSVNYGGGVYLSTNSGFKMAGGTIEECTNSYVGGAGVCVGAPGNSYMNSFEMSGGKIINCTANSNRGGLGGGVLIMNGLAQIKDSSKIYNNHAVTAGDDIFSYGLTAGRNPTNTRLKFGSVPEGLILTETNHEIDGWYVDGVANGEDTDRWDIDNFAQKYEPSPEVAIETQIALKAAHGPVDYNYYNYTVSYYINGNLHEDLTQTGKANTVYIDNVSVPDKCEIDSIEYIDSVEPTSQAPGNFEVNVYCSELGEEDLPKHESELDNKNSLVNEESMESEPQNHDGNINQQIPQTGDSILEQYIIFSIFLVSLLIAITMILDEKKKYKKI